MAIIDEKTKLQIERYLDQLENDYNIQNDFKEDIESAEPDGYDIIGISISYQCARYLSLDTLSRGRNYPVHLSEIAEGDEVVIYDMPSILNGIDKAIDMYFRVGHIGKKEDQQLAEEHEMANFENVLRMLISQDAFCKSCVEIVHE